MFFDTRIIESSSVNDNNNNELVTVAGSASWNSSEDFLSISS